MSIIYGFLERVTYYNEENDFIVGKLQEEGAGVCKPLIQMLRLSFDYLGMKFVGKILVTAYEKGEIGENQAELKRAYRLGMSLK